MNQECTPHHKDVLARLKSFDAQKGYGFLETPDLWGDILIQARHFGRQGVHRISVGMVLGARIIEVNKRLRCEKVLWVADIPKLSTSDLEDQLRFEPAKVLWYDDARGVGIVNLFLSEESIWLSKRVLLNAGLVVKDGDAIAVRVLRRSSGAAYVDRATQWPADAR